MRSNSAASRSRIGRAVCSSNRRFWLLIRAVSKRITRSATSRDERVRSMNAAAGMMPNRVRTSASTLAERGALSIADISPINAPGPKSPSIWVCAPSAVRMSTRTLPCSTNSTSVVLSSKSRTTCSAAASSHRRYPANLDTTSAGTPASRGKRARANAEPVAGITMLVAHPSVSLASRPMKRMQFHLSFPLLVECRQKSILASLSWTGAWSAQGVTDRTAQHRS